MRYDKALGPDNQHLADCRRTGNLGNLEPEPINCPSLVRNNSGGLRGPGIPVSLVQSSARGHSPQACLRGWRKLLDSGGCHRLCVFGQLDFTHACTRDFLHRPIDSGLPCHRINFRAGFVPTLQGSEIVVRFTRGSSAGTYPLCFLSR